MSKDDSDEKYHIVFTTDPPDEEEFEIDWYPSSESSATLVTTVSSSLGIDLPEPVASGVTGTLDDVSKWKWNKVEVEVNLGILKFKITGKKE